MFVRSLYINIWWKMTEIFEFYTTLNFYVYDSTVLGKYWKLEIRK